MLIDIAHYIALAVPIIPMVIGIVNNRCLDSLDDYFQTSGEDKPEKLISVLIPARNEEQKIGLCIKHLLSQDYTNLEILVLDDESIDNTGDIVSSFNDSRVRLIKGQPLPDGWTGKNWACHQLSQNANGEFFVFSDADTTLGKRVLTLALIALKTKKLDLVTLVPRRVTSNISERFMFPFIDWAIFCWLPMKLAYRSQNPQFSATYGQFMLFKRNSYFAIGGHGAVRDTNLDDFELGRLIKEQNFKWFLMHGKSQVVTLPYDDNLSAVRGISRSIFPALHYRLSLLLVMSFVLIIIGFIPLVTLVFEIFASDRSITGIAISFISFVSMAISWGVVCNTLGHNRVLALLFPVSILFMIVIAHHSLVSNVLGLTDWKGRGLTAKRLRF